MEGRTVVASILQTTQCVVKPDDTLDTNERFGTTYDYLPTYGVCTICSPVTYLEVKDKPCKSKGL
jgi:hypothetical protein